MQLCIQLWLTVEVVAEPVPELTHDIFWLAIPRCNKVPPGKTLLGVVRWRQT